MTIDPYTVTSTRTDARDTVLALAAYRAGMPDLVRWIMATPIVAGDEYRFTPAEARKIVAAVDAMSAEGLWSEEGAIAAGSFARGLARRLWLEETRATLDAQTGARS